jgi:hypothetical protein
VETGPARRYVTEEFMRAALAGAFVIIFFLTIIAAVIATCGGKWHNMKELLEILLPAETALLGSAVGYYFGTMQRGPQQPK